MTRSTKCACMHRETRNRTSNNLTEREMRKRNYVVALQNGLATDKYKVVQTYQGGGSESVMTEECPFISLSKM